MNLSIYKLAVCSVSVLLFTGTVVAQTRTEQEDPWARLLNMEMRDRLLENQGMSHDDLKEKHITVYESGLNFDVRDADYYQNFVSAFGLSGRARDTLDELGFVVVPGPAMKKTEVRWDQERDQEIAREILLPAGPTDVYYRVFAADLPVFISADSILHAWHRSFENMMMEEETDFYEPMRDLLDGALEDLDPTIQSGRDAMFYMSVARALAEYDWDDVKDWEADRDEPFVPHDLVKDEVNRFLRLVDAKQLKEVEFLGSSTWIDFSLFTPRGHYTRGRLLTKYFMMISWLSSIDLVLYHPHFSTVTRPREEAAARDVVRALKSSGGLETYVKIASFYSKVVGRPATMTPTKLLQLMNQNNEHFLTAEYEKVASPAYLSRAFESHSPPITMRFFPKRFAYDAWATAQTTTPELEPNVIGGRSMASEMDVAFALGSNRALDYLADDMKKTLHQNLPATLESLRQVFDSIPPTDLDNTVYNHLLEALAALSEPSTDPRYPQVIRTDTWHDRKLEAALASWAELRHDTVLIVEQSMGGSGCQYPKGYVEPIPELYRSLQKAASLMELGKEWQQTMDMLVRLSEKEILGHPMSSEDLEFLNQTVDMHRDRYSGDRRYTGWYPRLIYRDNGEKSEPVISDVHTDADYGKVLQVGVGHPGLMIVAIDNDGDRSLYGGPVYNYYSFKKKLSRRMNDDQWKKLLREKAPEKPLFTRKYWVHDNKTAAPPDKPSSRRRVRPGPSDFEF